MFITKLRLELKEKIIEQLNLEEFSVADIDDNTALFGDGLGLDSIDALELIVMLDKDYGIQLKDPKEGKEIFKSITVLADYIARQKNI
ncbi:phosphopantetheine-binding protein [bacterium]|nr:phosphopantetheine-binding protein [bacterium]